MTHTPHNDICSNDADEHPSSGCRLLITAGPTWEPIDAVRYLGNRSSGRLGVDLAAAARRAGWPTRLLLGVGASADTEPLTTGNDPVDVRRFQTTADLAEALDASCPWCDVLVMAAAVADYRPIVEQDNLDGKLRRTSGDLVIKCEPTPDLLASVAARKRESQLFVGFALEPEAEVEASGRRKLERKRVDLVVANPLETMDSPNIAATLLARDGLGMPTIQRLPETPKSEFGGVLINAIAKARRGLGVSV